MAVLGAGTATATGTADAEDRKPSPVGTWETRVTIGTGPDAMTATSHFVFAADHTLTTDGAPGADGRPQYPGTGYWTSREDGTFSFYITHAGPEESADGVYPGSVHAVHVGRIAGGRFTTTAVAFTRNEKTGALLGPISVSSEATRMPSATH
jgi:hypothetical protein